MWPFYDAARVNERFSIKPVSHGHSFGTMFQLVHYLIEETVLPFCIIQLDGRPNPP